MEELPRRNAPISLARGRTRSTPGFLRRRRLGDRGAERPEAFADRFRGIDPHPAHDLVEIAKRRQLRPGSQIHAAARQAKRLVRDLAPRYLPVENVFALRQIPSIAALGPHAAREKRVNCALFAPRALVTC